MPDNTKFYKLEEALAMLPYIQSFCKDITRLYKELERLVYWSQKLGKIITNDLTKKKKLEKLIQKIKIKSEIKVEKYQCWKNELAELNLTICSNKFGRIDIPVFDNYTCSIVLLCIETESHSKMIDCHSVSTNYKNAELYWGLFNDEIIKIKGKK